MGLAVAIATGLVIFVIAFLAISRVDFDARARARLTSGEVDDSAVFQIGRLRWLYAAAAAFWIAAIVVDLVRHRTTGSDIGFAFMTTVFAVLAFVRPQGFRRRQ